MGEVSMAGGSLKVTYKSPDEERVPDRLTEGALLLMDLEGRGRLAELAGRLRIRRQGGYCAFDVWLLLLLFFAMEKGRGIRGFWEILRPHAPGLAALAKRRRLPSAASVSRALSSVEVELLRQQSSWLLAGLPEIDDVLRHPAAQSYDAVGEGWHVFDLDPTVTTLRHRALPAGDDLPEARRRSKETGAPGHSGRKRGDVQFRRVTVQHSGSSMWVHAHLSRGNGEGMIDFERALDTIVETRERLEHPLSRTLVRMDGEYGNVPWFTACRERGLPFITRLNRPKLFKEPAVLKRLRSATWYRVPDSRAGPQRAAADLGEVTVCAGEKTRRPDGGRYEPVRLRVVASVFPKSRKAKRGRTLDGWQVELFAVDLPADGWPPADAVAAYFGRCAQENRFCQEDQELGLDRIISYHLPGQELACLVGLSVWNLRIARGFEMEPPPFERPVQPIRSERIDDRIPELWPRDPVKLQLLAELDWSAMLAQRPNWEWDEASGVLRCGEGRELLLSTVRPTEHAEGRTGIIFRRPSGGCQDCSSRPGCLRSKQEPASKHAEFAIQTQIANALRHRLDALRDKQEPVQTIEPIPHDPGPFMAMEALFLPAMARQVFTAAFLEASLHVHVELPGPEPERPRLVAIDVAARQRRRKTWADNLARYEALAGTAVRVELAGRPALRQMLGDPEQTTRVMKLAS